MEISKTEKARLNELEAYHIIGTSEETDFDSLTKIAAEICQTKMALISFVAKDRQWFKSHHGIDLTESSLDTSFCVYAIQEPDHVFIVEDTSKDDRFKDNSFVTSFPHIAFYAAVALVSPNGTPLGALSVMDDHPKKLNEIQIQTLQILANQAIRLLELRRMYLEADKEKQAKEKEAESLNKIMDASLDLICTFDMDGRFIKVSAAAEKILGYNPEELIGKNALDYVFEGDLEKTFLVSVEAVAGEEKTFFENRLIKKDGRLVPLIWSIKHDKKDNIVYAIARDGSEKKTAEIQLKNSEEKYRSLFNSSPLPKCIYDADTFEIIDINSSAIQQYGYSSAEFLNMTIIDLQAKEYDATFNSVNQDKGLESLGFGITTHKKKNGELISVELSGNKTEYLGKACIIAVFLDVTLREVAQAKLTESESRLRKAQKIAKIGYWYLHADLNSMEWSDEVYSILGLDKTAFQPRFDTFLDFIHPKDRQNFNWEGSSTAVNSELDFEHRILLQNGNTKWIHQVISIERDPQNQTLVYQGTVQDITLRKSEEQRLKLIESVITNTKDSVLITEAEPTGMPGPRIIFVNEAFTKMTGYEAEEVIGKTPRMLQGPKSNFAELAKLGEAMRKWETYEVTTINYKKNGDPFWNNFTVSPVADETGWYTHWIAIERDITLQKNQELEKQLFSDISLYFNKEEQLKPCLEFVVEKLAEFGDFSFAEIWLQDFAKTKLHMAAKYSLDQAGKDFYELSPEVTELKLGEGLPGRVWVQGKIEIYDGTAGENTFVRKNALTKSGLNSLIGIPLSHNGVLIGVIVVGIKKIKSKFSFFLELFKNLETFLGSEIKRKRLENDLDHFFSFAPDIICLVDFDGCFRKMNAAGNALLGYSEEETYGLHYAKLVHFQDREMSAAEFLKLRQGETVVNFENRYITKSGQIIWLSWTCGSAEGGDLMYAVAKNVTRLKKLQLLLDDSSKLAKVGSWEIDLVQDTVYWSDTTKEIREVGKDFEPTLSKGMAGFVTGYDQDTIQQRVKGCIEKGIPWDEELRIITDKGNLKWVRTIGKPVFENGKCVRVFGSFQDIQQLKVAEINLKESLHSLESYKFALDQSAIIAITDEKGVILSVNDNFCEISKYSKEEIIGSTHRVVNSGFHSKDFFTTFWDTISSGKVWRGEIKNKAKDKSFNWVDTTIVPFIGADGKPFQYLAISFDITSRKLAEETLLATLKEKEIILESIDDGFFTVDKDWVITYWNNRAEILVEKRRTETIGKNYWLAFPESIGTEFYKEGIWAMENGKSVQFEEYSPKIDKWIETNIYPSDDGLSVYFKDISIRKVADEQIRLSNERFEKVTEVTDDAIWDWDIHNGNLYRGKGFEKLLGGEVKYALHKDNFWTDRFHPDDLDDIISSVNSAIEDPNIKNWIHEYRINNENLGYRTVIDRGVIIRDSDGKAVRMVGAITDITHQKEYEESLKNLNQELEKRAKELEFSNSELEQFAFVASHDLQEPLRMVSSFMTQLDRKYGHLLDEKAHTYIDFATDGAKRMKQIIRDLLEYSRAGKPESDREQINLKEMIENYLSLRKRLLADNGGSIKFDSLPTVVAFKAPLEQTIYNLLDNALKYSKPFVPPVVSFTVEEKDDYWLFSIKDNGLGIEKESFDKIFIIFQRLHNKDAYTGTGMGLAIVKKNIESWNGKIWLDSKKGTGTTFHFTLPK